MEEGLRIMRNTTLQMKQIKELRDEFKNMDKDKSNEISKEELQAHFETLNSINGNSYDEELVEKMMKNADKDGQGGINFEEYCVARQAAEGKIKMKNNMIYFDIGEEQDDEDDDLWGDLKLKSH